MSERWNETCMITHLPILQGDDVVLAVFDSVDVDCAMRAGGFGPHELKDSLVDILVGEYDGEGFVASARMRQEYVRKAVLSIGEPGYFTIPFSEEAWLAAVRIERGGRHYSDDIYQSVTANEVVDDLLSTAGLEQGNTPLSLEPRLDPDRRWRRKELIASGRMREMIDVYSLVTRARRNMFMSRVRIPRGFDDFGTHLQLAQLAQQIIMNGENLDAADFIS